MEWDITLNQSFDPWFNELEVDAQDEVLATLCLLIELGPLAVQSRLDSIKELSANSFDAQNSKKTSAKRRAKTKRTLHDYLIDLPPARRENIEGIASRLRAELIESQNSA